VPAMSGLVSDTVDRYAGDMATLGKGEILVPRP
jgi:hypothetical protein